jgi:glycosyltransferase involved in cell wall biosynthesis
VCVDVTPTATRDLGTGIQRVVRAQTLALLLAPPPGVDVVPVRLAATDTGVGWWTTKAWTRALLGLPPEPDADTPIAWRRGDVLYMPDLDPLGFVAAHRTGALDMLRTRGVRVCVLVHDILPLVMPHHFPPGSAEHHGAWLRVVLAVAERVVCISAAVATSVHAWVRAQTPPIGPVPPISVLHHGADVEATRPTIGLPAVAPRILAAIAHAPTFLMVGSIEPRKQHIQALRAFDELWHSGLDVNLVIVGRHIWRAFPDAQRGSIQNVVNTLKSHHLRDRRLFWVDDASDEFLELLYANCACLIAASEDEGFALPLVEAARHGLPIIARDVPVMREVTHGHALFFRGMKKEDLRDTLLQWLELHASGKLPDAHAIPILTWRENARNLSKLLLGPAGDTHAA